MSETKAAKKSSRPAGKKALTTSISPKTQLRLWGTIDYIQTKHKSPAKEGSTGSGRKVPSSTVINGILEAVFAAKSETLSALG